MRQYVAELIGTFFLVLTIGLTAGTDHAASTAPLAIGCILMVMIYAGGHLSGAHYNPAVTLAFWMIGRCPRAAVPGYLASQLVGAVAAAGLVGYLATDATTSPPSLATGPLVVAEVLFTFALCWVILNVAAAKGTTGNPFYGVAIALTVTAAIYAVGPISGAVLNPAVAVALCAMGLSIWGTLGVYVLAQTLAAVIAVVVFKSQVES